MSIGWGCEKNWRVFTSESQKKDDEKKIQQNILYGTM